MKLRLRAQRLEIQTKDGLYGTQLQFAPKGLTVIRAENTSGKSTCINAALYALGLEAMLGTSREVPLPSVVTTRLQSGDKQLDVIESSVLLELQNSKGDVYTIKRQIKGTKDKRLIERFDGALISDPGRVPPKQSDFFVRVPGGATRERGFHTWLAEYMGWKLPEVQKYDGETSPLYLECIFPLNFIEQKRGWTGIQANMPTQYRIRDVRQRALEFVLNLDKAGLERKAQQIKDRIDSLKVRWRERCAEIELLTGRINAVIDGLSQELQATWPPTPYPTVRVTKGENWIVLGQFRKDLEQRLKQLEHEEIPTTAGIAAELTEKLKTLEESLYNLDMLSRTQIVRVEELEAERSLLHERALSIEEDIRQHQDAQLLVKYKSQVAKSIDLDRCPVCSRDMDGTVAGQASSAPAMTIEDNISFLQEERKAVQVMVRHAEKNLGAEQKRLNALRDGTANARAHVRAAKESLVEDGRLPSSAAIRERIEVRETLQLVAEIGESLDVNLEALSELATQYQKELAEQKLIPKGLTKSDTDKLSRLGELVREQLKLYGFTSFKPEEMKISPDTYHPIVSDLDWYFEASASDNIRAIWAYTLGLLELSRAHEMAHPGFLIFDEPRQHSAKGDSMAAFLKRASSSLNFDNQVIIATSESSDLLKASMVGITGHVIDFPAPNKIVHKL